MNKKKVLIEVISISVIAIFAITLSLTLFKSDDDNEIYQSKVGEKVENQVGGFLTLMLETEAGSGQYQESTSGTWPRDEYIFNENMSACQNGGELSWDSSTNTVNLLTNTSDACYVYFDKKVTLAELCNGLTLSECITTQIYDEEAEEATGLYFHDTNLANGAGDNSYRYAGANPNNYVCFGSDAATCPSDNLYRIIGVFGDEVKLIKNTSIGKYYWSGSRSNQSNTWSNSTLNTNTLNGTYLAGLDNNSWSSMITTHTWKVGGMSSSNGTGAPKTAYNYEVGANSSSTPYNAKIGLMYVSDYGFAASNTYWSTELGDYDSATSNNWLYLGSNELTISRNSGSSINAFRVDSGGVNNSRVYSNLNAVRPVFYLSSFVQYSGGEGTLENPIRLSNNEIQFTIEGIQYTALEGMKWGDWISSEYNTSEYQQHCTNDYVSVDCRGITGVIDNTNSTSVTITDKIYPREYSHGGMHEPCSCVTLPEM